MSVTDFTVDVADPNVLQAESLVFAALQRLQFWQVTDCRTLRTFYDFTIVSLGRRRTVDAKYDRWIDKSNRIVLEVENRYDNGHIQPKWGMNPGLDYVAVVGESMRFAYMVRVPEFRELVIKRTHTMTYCPDGWKVTEPRNNGYITYGYAVPIRELTTCKILAMNLPLKGDL